MEDCAKRLNVCPLGSGAVAGATLQLDRTMIARELGFDAPTANSMDATSDRDFALEYLQSLAQIALHVSRFAEEITLYATAEFGFVDLPEAFSTGSSAMPQKKNPDLTELARAKSGRIIAASHTVELQLKGLPLAYNKDMQETQEALFAATKNCMRLLSLLGRFTAGASFPHRQNARSLHHGFLNAMAAATYLVHKGVAFRTAHEIIGNAVRHCLGKGCELDGLTLEELRQFSPAFEQDFFAAITLEATLDCHDVVGGTARSRVREALARAELQHLSGLNQKRLLCVQSSVRRIADERSLHREGGNMRARKARLPDANAINGLIRSLSYDGTLLPRSLRKSTRIFVISQWWRPRRRISRLRCAASLWSASGRDTLDRCQRKSKNRARAAAW